MSIICQLRLFNQQISAAQFNKPEEVVNWMGAMQAQDLTMAKWALGLRLPKSTDKTIQAALDKGTIIRTHLLRPTWHLVASANVYWMLELTAPQIAVKLKPGNKRLELTTPVLKKANKLIEKALSTHKQLSRNVLVAMLSKAGIRTDDVRAAYILMNAELDGLICSGAMSEKTQTYALLEERVPKPSRLSREEALAKLAQAYFTSHSPASLQDFIWWSGLGIRDAKAAREAIRASFPDEKIEGETYIVPHTYAHPPKSKARAYLLPAFDEYIIGYKNRTAVISLTDHPKAISNNGIFRPVILIDGVAAGLWSRMLKPGKIIVQPQFFQAPETKTHRLLEKSAGEYADFLGLNAEITD